MQKPYPCPCPDGCNGCNMEYSKEKGWYKPDVQEEPMQQAFMKELRELAMAHHADDVRKNLRQLAESVDYTFKMFEAVPSIENLRRLNGHWAHAKAYYDTIVLNGGNDPQGGALPVEQERKAA